MKNFKQFQEEIKTGGTIKKPTVNINGKELPSLGGGGGGTNAITMKSKSKTLGKRLKDTAKLATTPFRAVLGIKSKQDAKEKFASEEVMAAGPTNNQFEPELERESGEGREESREEEEEYFCIDGPLSHEAIYCFPKKEGRP